MNIRTKLTLRFILITAIIILLGSVSVYIFSADYRKADFYDRLQNKANNTAKLLIEVDEVDVRLLRRLERDNPVSLANEKITVYNYRDSILFTTDEKSIIRISKSLLNQIRLEEEVRYRQEDYEVIGFLFKGKYDRFVVVAAATDINGFKKLQNLRYILFSVFSVSIVLVSITGWLFAGKALQPIAKVVNQVDEISISSLNLRVDEGNGKDEIAKLAQTFNSMLSRLETSFAIQKQFIANASHELRTPLTAITGQLEVTLLNTRSKEEYQQVLRSILDDIKALNNLSNRLLLLAQSTSAEREKRMTHLRIDDMLWQVKDELLKHHAEYNILIDFSENVDDDSKLTVRGDEQLIKTALSNLIDNGCKYSGNRSTKILIETTGDELCIVFKDEGIGIPVEDLPNIYEPFYRGSNTTNIKGHGIGLSIVKGIIKLHSGKMDIVSSAQTGTTITVNFPILSEI